MTVLYTKLYEIKLPITLLIYIVIFTRIIYQRLNGVSFEVFVKNLSGLMQL